MDAAIPNDAIWLAKSSRITRKCSIRERKVLPVPAKAKEYLYKTASKYWVANTLMLGIFLTVAGYHLLIFLFRKRYEYLYFSLFIISYTIVFAGFSSLLSEWGIFVLSYNYIIIIFSVCWTLTYLFLFLFTRKFLDLTRHLPKVNKFWLAFIFLE